MSVSDPATRRDSRRFEVDRAVARNRDQPGPGRATAALVLAGAAPRPASNTSCKASSASARWRSIRIRQARSCGAVRSYRRWKARRSWRAQPASRPATSLSAARPVSAAILPEYTQQPGRADASRPARALHPACSVLLRIPVRQKQRARTGRQEIPMTTPTRKARRRRRCAALAASASQASSHREAPNITRMPAVDATDFYMFNSYEPGPEELRHDPRRTTCRCRTPTAARTTSRSIDDALVRDP